MKSNILTLLLNLFLATVSFGQSDSLLNKIVGKWYVEKMSSDTIVLSKEVISTEIIEDRYKTIRVHFYDDMVNRIDEIISDLRTYEERVSVYAHRHSIFKKGIWFKGYFEQSHWFEFCHLDSDRIVLCKYTPPDYNKLLGW